METKHDYHVDFSTLCRSWREEGSSCQQPAASPQLERIRKWKDALAREPGHFGVSTSYIISVFDPHSILQSSLYLISESMCGWISQYTEIQINERTIPLQDLIAGYASSKSPEFS